MKGTRRIAARISSALFAINVVRDGAEPKTKREGLQTLLGGSIPSRASIDRSDDYTWVPPIDFHYPVP